MSGGARPQVKYIDIVDISIPMPIDYVVGRGRRGGKIKKIMLKFMHENFSNEGTESGKNRHPLIAGECVIFLLEETRVGRSRDSKEL